MNKKFALSFLLVAMLQGVEIYYLQILTDSFAIIITMIVSVMTWLVYAGAWYNLCSLEWDNNSMWIANYRLGMLRKLVNQAKIHVILVQIVVLTTYLFTSEDSTARFIIVVFGTFGQGIIPEYWMGLMSRSVQKLEVKRGTMQVFKFSSGRHIKASNIDQPSLCLLHRDEFKSKRPHQDEVLWETRDIAQTESAPWPLIAYTSYEKLIVEVFI